MKRVLTGQEPLFGPWMMLKLGGTWTPGKGSIIGLWDDKIGPVAGCLYEGSNGASIMMHCVGVGKSWLNREFLWFSFYYPFEQLGLKKVICPVEPDNEDSQKFLSHLGFQLEATLKDASPKGDLLIFTLSKDRCKWLSLKDSYRGKTKRSSSS